MNSDVYEVYAVKYGHHARRAADNFVGGDPHDAPMPLDYYVWVVRNAVRTFIVDTGFNADAARTRGRILVHGVADGLATLGITPGGVEDVILTHLHYDHAGNVALFGNARFHLQDREMAFATGRCMCHTLLSHGYDADDVTRIVYRVFDRRVEFHDGSACLAPGLEVHHVGGHTAGLQAVRVMTRRGWVVLASDASHFYAHMEEGRAFPVLYALGELLEGYQRLRALAASPRHVIPGHDPLVLQYYPAPRPELAGWVARLDVEPALRAGV
ncbi:MAG: N-acyl homoserine lactonase family protein [Gammaproteobacteria bacterium]|nr:N-acyl homoserine lactonase family protein [Gammaproteobacteria bacterium]